MGLQVPCRYRAQATAQSNFREDASASGTDFPYAGPAKGVPDYRRASDAGPCAHVYRDSPQAPGGFRDRVSEREECDRYCPAVREGAEFHGRTSVGPRLRCELNASRSHPRSGLSKARLSAWLEAPQEQLVR